MRLKIVLCLFLVVGLLFRFAQPLQAMDKAQAIAALMQKQPQFNGSVLVASQGQVLYEKSFGYANFTTFKAMKTDSCFNLASLSKPFTALAVMMLAEQGKLTYEDNVSLYLPGFPYQGVQIKHLLWHTSGLPDYIELAAEHWDQENLLTNADLLQLFKAHHPPALHRPGEVYDYSNTGYSLLALIVAKASGQSFDVFMQQHIFTPLNMKNTFVYTPANAPKYESCRVYGYDPKSQQPDDLTYLDGVVGDGGIYSSVEDLLKWDQALYTEKLVTAATLKKAFQPGRLNNGKKTEYGFGWLVDGDDGEWVSHAGSWAAFRSSLSRYLKTRQTVILLSNTNNETLSDIEEAIMAILN